MITNKLTLHVEIEALSSDVFPGLISELEDSLTSENVRGNLIKDDGDSIKWWTTSEDVKL